MATAKKSHRIRVPDRSKLSDGVEQRREYARNYNRIREAVDEVLKKYWGQDGRSFSNAVMAIVRELTGCRITEIGDSDIDDALACVQSTHHLIKNFRWHLECENTRRKWEEREQKEREQRAAASSAAMDRIIASTRSALGLDERATKAPVLSLVPDCGRYLPPRDFDPSAGPYPA